MTDYPLVGEQASQGQPAVFELRLFDHLHAVRPDEFKLPLDTPSLDPRTYFVTSGDAVAKACQLELDTQKLVWRVAAKSKKSKALTRYLRRLQQLLKDVKGLRQNLVDARGDSCFLETEWRSGALVVIPKNPRVRE